MLKEKSSTTTTPFLPQPTAAQMSRRRRFASSKGGSKQKTTHAREIRSFPSIIAIELTIIIIIGRERDRYPLRFVRFFRYFFFRFVFNRRVFRRLLSVAR